jgi:hypothetical protein
MLRFRQMRSLHTFAAARSPVHTPFNLERHHFAQPNFRENRAGALSSWRERAG